MRAFSQPFPRFDWLGRRAVITGVLFASALVVMLVTSMVLTALGDVARHANRLDDNRSAETARGALKIFRDQLATTLNDYVAWDDAAKRVYAKDVDWVVSNMLNGDVFDVAIVVGTNRDTILAYRSGQPMGALAADYFEPSIWALLDRARNAGPENLPQATGFVRTRDGIAAAGVALIRMASGALPVPADQGRYLVFVKHLSAERVAKLGETYVIDGLRLAAAADPSAAFVTIDDPGGAVLGKLVWTSRSPGGESYAQVQPVVLAAIGIIAIFFMLLFLIGAFAFRRLKADEASARTLSRQDRLSGLFNREGLYEALTILIQTARSERSDILLLYLDLDGFKDVNDTYGHGTGDCLIRAVSAGLRVLAPENAVLARIGGDEFAIAVCTSNIDGLAAELGESILNFFGEPFVLGERVAVVGASIGASSSPLGLVGCEEVIRRADMAMYQAKDSGRGRLVRYDPAMDAEREERNRMELDLRDAIENDGLDVIFQPVVKAGSYRLAGVEALVRWNRPGYGAVAPEIFIPVAEATGLIDALGLFVLYRTCLEAARWPDIRIAVNISPGQFRDPAFADHVGAVLRETGTDPSRVTLEMTEGYLIQNPERAGAAIERLKAVGVAIALDDFGAGFASIGYLRQFGFDRMKIDRSLIDALDENERAHDTLQATVALARSLDIPVTAEGVEREDQALILHLCGCDELQGFLFGKPVYAGEIDRIIREASNCPADEAESACAA